MSNTPTPGHNALQTMKALEKSITEFKKPPIPQRKQKATILTEEKYIEELSKIIQRDFFPDLEKLRAQNDYLDALERNDYRKVRELFAKYSGRKFNDVKRGVSPATFETPKFTLKTTPEIHSQTESTNTSETSSRKKQKSISDNHSLDSFLDKFTSEDNYSFEEIIETADQKLRQKFAVFYNEEPLSADKITKALALPSIEKQFESPDPLRKIETWAYTNKNYIMYIPNGVELTNEEKLDLINKKQTIHHSNTRLLSNPFNEHQNKETMSEIAKCQSRNQNGKVGVDGNIVHTTGVPNVRGFDLVQTPSPCPGEAFSPLMTWGEIEGTPFRLDGDATPLRSSSGPSFRINETSRREAIGLQLAEKVGEKMRAQKQRAKDTARKNISSPFIRSSIDRLASMSPAAKRLATMKLGLQTPVFTPNVDTDRSPMGNNSVTQMQRLAYVAKRKTPSIHASFSKQESSITDNLLQIPPKRKNAADFF